MGTAWLFPGRGSRRGMRERVAELRPDLLDAAVELAGCDPFERGDRGTSCQPATYCASLAGLRALGDEQPDCYVGHALGEIAALAAAGCIGEHDGLRLVTLRARLAQHVDDASHRAAASVAERLRALLWEVDVSAPRRPCLSCATGDELADVRRRLAQPPTTPLRWGELLCALRKRGIDRCVDVVAVLDPARADA